MANKVEKITIQIDSSFNTNKIESSAKKIQEVLSKVGISEESNKKLRVYSATIEELSKKASEITMKGIVTEKDLKNLNLLFSQIEDNYNKISEMGSDFELPQLKIIQELNQEIKDATLKTEEAIDKIKAEFSGASKAILGKKLDFGDYENELASIDAQISKTTDEITRKNSEGQQSIDELTQKSLDSFKKGNGAKFKNLDDLVKYTESKEKEVLDIETKYGLTKEKRLREYKKAGLDNRTVSMNEDLIESQKNREKAIESINSAQAKLDISTKKEIENLKILEGRRETLATTYNETSEKIIIENKNLQNSINTREGLIDTIEDQRLAQEQQLREEIKLAQSPATEAINKNKNAISGFFKKLSEAQGLNKAIGDSFDRVSAKIKSVTSAVYLLNIGWRKLQEAGSIVSALDKQLTEIAIVTKQTTDTMWNSFDTFNRAAMSLSSTTLQYLEGAKIFYQQGLNTAEVMKMVEATTKAAALSGVSFAAASETLTAAINAYQMGASKAMEVTDKLAAVGAASASDFQELSTAMEKVASQAYSSGMSFDSLVGILAKGIETTREAPEAIGTGLKSIIARFQEMKENPMADLEDGVNANRVEKALKSVGVALRDSNGEFRNMDDVFADLGESWKTMSRNQRAYIATMAAGSRQQSRFMAIMTNYDRTLSLIRTSTNSAGAANQQYAIYTDSVEAANKRMTNSLERLYTTILSSDAIKQLYDGLSTLFQIVTDLNPFAIALVGSIGLLITKVTAFTSAQKILAATSVKDVMGALNPLAKLIAGPFIKNMTDATQITQLQTIAQNALNASLAIGIAVIGALVFAYVAYTKAKKDAAMAYQREASLLSEKAQAEREDATNLKTKVERYEELSKKVNKSNEEQSEYLALIKEISDIAPELISGIDSEGNAILARTDVLKEAVKQYEADARAADIAASKARLAAQAHAEWNAAVEEGAVGPKTAEAAAYIETSMKNLEKSVAGTFGQKWGGQVITSNLAKAIAKGADPKELRKYAKKGIDQAEFLGSILPAAGAGIGAAVGALTGASITAAAGGGGGVLGAKIGAGAGLAAGGALANTFFFSEKELTEIEKQTGSMIDQYENYLKIKLAETRSSISRELNVIGQTSLDAIEANGETVSVGYRNVLSSMTQMASQMAMQGVEGAKAQAEAIAQNAPQIFDELMLQLESYRTKAGFQTALSEILTIKDQGASIRELQTQVQELLSAFTIDPQSDLGKAISGSIFNQEQFRKDMTTLALSVGRDLDETFVTQLEGTFSNFSTKLKDYFLTTFDSIETGPEKERLLQAFSNVYNNPELAKVINDSFDKLDQTNASEMKAFTESLAMNLYEAGGNIYKNYQEAYSAAILAISQQTQDALAFIKTAQDTYKELSSLVDLSKKATAGTLGLGDAFDYILKHGEDALTAVRIVGDQIFISYSAIESRIREGNIKIANAFQNASDSTKSQIADLQASIAELEKQKNDLIAPKIQTITPEITPTNILEEDNKNREEGLVDYEKLNNDQKALYDEQAKLWDDKTKKEQERSKSQGFLPHTIEESQRKKEIDSLYLYAQATEEAVGKRDQFLTDVGNNLKAIGQASLDTYIINPLNLLKDTVTDVSETALTLITGKTYDFNQAQIEANSTTQEAILINKNNFAMLENGVNLTENLTESKQKEIESINNSINAKKEEINSLEAQSQAYDDIIKAMDAMNNSIVEQAKLQNQNVLTAISGINQQLNSYSDFSDILDKLNNGGMSFLETLQAVGKNPDLIAAIDLQNEGLTFSKDKIEEIRKAKIQETIDFLKGERAKLTAINTMAQYELGLIKNISAEDTKAAQIALESYKDEGESLNDLYTAEEKLQQLKLDDVKQFTDEYTKMSNEIDRQNQEVAKNNPNLDPSLIKGPTGITSKYVGVKATTGGSAYQTTGPTFKEKYGEGAYTIPGVGIYSPITGKIDYYPTPNKVMATGAERSYALALGIDPTGMTSKQVWQAVEKKTAEDGLKLDKLVLEANQNLANAMDELGGGKASSKSIEELNDTLEKFYNTLREIDNLQQDMSSIQARIDLEKTGAEEDINLLKEKAGVLNDLINLQEYLNSERKKELDKMKDQLSKYSEFLYFEGEVLKVRQASLSLALVTGAMTQEQYDDTVNFLQQYTEMLGQIRNTEQEILDLQKERETMYDDIVNGAIETRQRIYDAILEADQKELDQLTEKYDKMKELEDDYLSAVKNAIDKERSAREEAAKKEDLAVKRRRLAVLERDTSGMYATEVQKLKTEISTEEQAARDEAIDKQYEALQKQISLQQEQRDTQIKFLEEQMRFREDTSFYWNRVDETIKAGPNAMLRVLTSSSQYGGADPLSQIAQLEEFENSVQLLGELTRGVGNGNVVDAIVEEARKIVGAISSIPTPEPSGTGETTGGDTGGGGIDKGTTPPSNSTPALDNSKKQAIKDLQTFIAKQGFNPGAIDGISGTKTQTQMNYFLNSALIRLRKINNAAGVAAVTAAAQSHNISPTAWSAIASVYPGFPSSAKGLQYERGGMVDYTGPAWVDGTKNKPEAFLSAKQTSLFENLRDLLAQTNINDILSSENQINNNISIGDIIINLQNKTSASADEIAKMVRKEIVGSYSNRIPTSIQKVR